MFLLTNAFRCDFKDFQIVAGNELQAGFLMVKDTGGGFPPSSCIFEDVVIEGVSSGQGVIRGWDISEIGTAGAANNEWHTFINCAVFNYKESGWRIGHTNVKTIRFYGCVFGALTGVGEQGVFVEKGSFHWHGGGGYGNQTADFYITESPDACSVIGGDFENSKRLLASTTNPSGAPGVVTIQSTRWDSAQMHADGNMIFWRHPSLVLLGNLFGNGGETTPTVIKHSQGSREGFFTCIGNQFVTIGSSDTEPYDVEDDTNCHIEGNFFRDDSEIPTTNSAIPDGDATPKLWANKYFTTGNTSPTTITAFVGGNAQIGQPKTIVFKDALTTIDFTGTNLKGNAGADWKPAVGDSMTCVYDGTDWHCDIVDLSGIPYGACQGMEIGWTQANAVQNQWYDISDADFVTTQLNGITHDGNGQLTVLKAGAYSADWAGAFEADAAGVHIQITFSVNGTPTDFGMNHFKTIAVLREFPIAAHTILNLEAGDTVNVALRTSDVGTPDLLVDHLLIRLFMIGGI